MFIHDCSCFRMRPRFVPVLGRSLGLGETLVGDGATEPLPAVSLGVRGLKQQCSERTLMPRRPAFCSLACRHTGFLLSGFYSSGSSGAPSCAPDVPLHPLVHPRYQSIDFRSVASRQDDHGNSCGQSQGRST
jgi:hypothetical protein